jgi:hypothetical protein
MSWKFVSSLIPLNFLNVYSLYLKFFCRLRFEEKRSPINIILVVTPYPYVKCSDLPVKNST